MESIILLAVIQGITEFLPVSSSSHLNLVHIFGVSPDGGVHVDIAVHVGSLLAVLVYFRHDIMALAKSTPGLVAGKPSPEGRILLWLIVASLPLGVAGGIVLAGGYIDMVRTGVVIAWANIIFAVLLYAADKTGAHTRNLQTMTAPHALLVGIAQMCALIPGASRAGVTITMSRALGYDRQEAARFSMLLAIPAIAGAGLGGGLHAFETGTRADLADLALGAGLSFLAALTAIAFFMRLLAHINLTVFVVYRLVLGAALLGWLYSG
ncbi:MAG: undecaprenyl-diphosphate phosphatase [Parvularculales bacterium]